MAMAPPLSAAVFALNVLFWTVRLPAGMVILPGEAKPAAMRSIDLAFEELAAGPDTKVVLDAHWSVSGVARHERIEVPIASLDSTAIASGMSQALAALADRIVASLLPQ